MILKDCYGNWSRLKRMAKFLAMLMTLPNHSLSLLKGINYRWLGRVGTQKTDVMLVGRGQEDLGIVLVDGILKYVDYFKISRNIFQNME